MVKFGQYLKHNIVPEWRDKFIDYKGLKKLINAEFNSKPQDIEMQIQPPTTEYVYTKDRSKDSFRRINLDSTDGMITLGTNQRTASCAGNEYTFTAVNDDELGEALLIRTNRTVSQLEMDDGSISYQWVIPEEYSCFEQQFFKKLYDEIQMVNKWYVEKANECTHRYNDYVIQVNHFCNLREQGNELSRSSSAYRNLEFGLKELYRMLEYLHNYCTLNRTAIDKILKKHDKHSELKSRATVVSAISEFRFYKEQEVSYLRECTEIIWRQFIGKNSSKTIRELKNVRTYVHTGLSFWIGLFVGGSIMLAFALGLLIYQYPIKSLTVTEIRSFGPPIRLQIFYVIQLWMWALDLYVYHNNRINFEYIFGEYAPKLLHFQQQCYFASIYTFILLLILFLWYYLSFVAKIIPKSYQCCLTPVLFLLFLVYILPLPGYFKARLYAFVHCISIIRVPFYHVHFTDFFIGDQLTSHNQTLVDLVHVLINICSLSFTQLHDKYDDFSPTTVEWLKFIPNMLPTFIRFIQCIRRYYDSHDFYPHGFNGIKYFMSLVAMSFTWNTEVYCVLQLFYTCYALNWDLREDWGVFHNNQPGKWRLLRTGAKRSRHLLSDAYKYYLAIINNILLRFMWVVKLCTTLVLSSDVSQLLFGSIEVIRRGIWNIFRMENEQVNNCGKFRATLDVPVPFPDLLR